MYSPKWLFLVPGAMLIVTGLLGYGLAFPGLRIAGITLGAHTLLVASLAILLGYQCGLFAIVSKTVAISNGLIPEDPRLDRFFRLVRLEKGLLTGACSVGIGLSLLVGAVNQWRVAQFGPLDYGRTMRWVIPGVTLCTFGFQTIFSSFLVSILGVRHK
jgi:hypothetical protein